MFVCPWEERERERALRRIVLLPLLASRVDHLLLSRARLSSFLFVGDDSATNKRCIHGYTKAVWRQVNFVLFLFHTFAQVAVQ